MTTLANEPQSSLVAHHIWYQSNNDYSSARAWFHGGKEIASVASNTVRDVTDVSDS